MRPEYCINKKSFSDLSQIIEFLKIISDKNRLKILYLLKTKQKCVCDIWRCLNLPQNLASHHLKVLKDSGLIDFRKEGLKVIYSINKKVIKKYSKLLNKFLNS